MPPLLASPPRALTDRPDLLARGVRVVGLLHDTTRPMKAMVPGIAEMEQVIQHAIADALMLPAFDAPTLRLVKEADNWALACEAWHLMPSKGRTWFCADLYATRPTSATGTTR